MELIITKEISKGHESAISIQLPRLPALTPYWSEARHKGMLSCRFLSYVCSGNRTLLPIRGDPPWEPWADMAQQGAGFPS